MGGSWEAKDTTKFMGGLRRRNNELNELTNFLAARDWGEA